jgi:uncharacterized membrane-anchored protein YhcB (DUF1043 family)
MSNAFFACIAGIFIGAVFFELGKRAKTKKQFAQMLEGLLKNEANHLLRSTISKDEQRLVSDLT